MTSERTLEQIEWHLVIEKIKHLCKNEPAIKIIESISTLSQKSAGERLAYITELKELVSCGEGPDLSGLIDISVHTEKASKGGMLSIEELYDVRCFSVVSGKLKTWFENNSTDNPAIKREKTRTADTSRFDEIITGSITETGELNESRYPALKKIKTGIRKTRAEAEKVLNKILYSSANDKILQEKIFTTRNERYVVLIKSGMKGRLGGSVQDYSSSGATIYLEPSELIPLNDRLIMLDRELQDETLRILKELSGETGNYREELQINFSVYAYLSAVEALARFSIKTLSNPPVLTDEPALKLLGARHPLLQLMIPESIVSNDVELGYTYDCLIISGANTGGKTALLKTVGLCVHMASCGMHIPAGPDSRMGIFDRIMADIGDDQNISESLSTFSGQILEFNRMIKEADKRTLILIDEIMAGTNPDEGTLLAAAILEALADRGAKLIAATHYPGLKELQARDSRFMNASVVFDSDSMKPVYRLLVGLPGLSYAFEIARNCGLPDEIIEKAKSMKDDSESSVDFLIERAARRDRELGEEIVKVTLLKNQLEKEKELLEEKQLELKQKSRKINRAEANSFIAELEAVREQINSRLKELNSMGREDLEKISRETAGISEKIRTKEKENARLEAEEKYSSIESLTLSSGDTVFIVPLEKNGTVEEVDHSKKRARVLFGSSIRSYFEFKDLLLDRKSSDSGRDRTKVVRVKAPLIPQKVPLTVQTSYNTIDLRGKRVEEGLGLMESELDRMSRSGISAAIIIHGHGTGAMKEAVRSALKDSYYCSSFRSGEQGEGGDGVTVASLSG